MQQENRVFRWLSLFGEQGVEQCSIQEESDYFLARGEVIYSDEYAGLQYGLTYQINLDGFRRVIYTGITHNETGQKIELHSNGLGQWFEYGRGAQRDLVGSMDIDIIGSSFAKTIPIRRLDMMEDDMEDIQVAFVLCHPHGFDVRMDEVKYSCLQRIGEIQPDARLFRYRLPSMGLNVNFWADEDGFVKEITGDGIANLAAMRLGRGMTIRPDNSFTWGSQASWDGSSTPYNGFSCGSDADSDACPDSDTYLDSDACLDFDTCSNYHACSDFDACSDCDACSGCDTRSSCGSSFSGCDSSVWDSESESC
ncbi:putative glycolipid-binding-domain-containing protein [Aspergillus crustosus]